MIVLRASRRSIAAAVQVLREGGLVVYPTETSYGLAVDPRQPRALAHLFAFKGRTSLKAVSLVAADTRQASRVVTFSPRARRLATQFWPGPLTLVLPPSRGGRRLPAPVRPQSGVAIRVPAHAFARALADAHGFPLTATSANRSGRAPAYSLTGFRRGALGTRQLPELFLDAGTLPRRRASTLVTVRGPAIRILREGPVTATQIARVV